MENDTIVRAWENRVGEETAHLKEGQTVTAARLNGMFKSGLQGINVKDKRILDYGCGGGFLGKFLFEEDYPIAQYLGMDITHRAMDATLRRLEEYKKAGKVEVTKINPTDIPDLSLFKVDILTCFNVIQHFGDKEYFEYFFKKLNNSEIPVLIFNYRQGETVFQDHPYKTTHEINLACYTNFDDIQALLTNYEPIKAQKKNKAGFQTVQFRVKK